MTATGARARAGGDRPCRTGRCARPSTSAPPGSGFQRRVVAAVGAVPEAAAVADAEQLDQALAGLPRDLADGGDVGLDEALGGARPDPEQRADRLRRQECRLVAGPHHADAAWLGASVAIFATSFEAATPIEIDRPVSPRTRCAERQRRRLGEAVRRPVEPGLVDRERLDDRARRRAGSPSADRSRRGTARGAAPRTGRSGAIRERHRRAHAAVDAERPSGVVGGGRRSSAATCADRGRPRSGGGRLQAPAARSPRRRSRSGRRRSGRCSGARPVGRTLVGTVHALSGENGRAREAGAAVARQGRVLNPWPRSDTQRPASATTLSDAPCLEGSRVATSDGPRSADHVAQRLAPRQPGSWRAVRPPHADEPRRSADRGRRTPEHRVRRHHRRRVPAGAGDQPGDLAAEQALAVRGAARRAGRGVSARGAARQHRAGRALDRAALDSCSWASSELGPGSSRSARSWPGSGAR